ncbi:hypothetical protein ABXI34_004252 [Salmonella enterica]|nr:hypothetical protein [Salmonella enterica]EBL3325374.1 hypothetical protein [Salmonella enterica subsp. enterica]EDR3674769.1 hypothetical protein [Salmonella enterica subsp. arizonae serovar 40:z4,z24:]EAW1058443.1 hypothetical protein [Salmonella enterica]EAZ0444781.1 hypothetical protein [Salmonella enterica]
MKRQLFALMILVGISPDTMALMSENLSVSLGDITLKPRTQKNTDALAVTRIDLPPVCEEVCQEGGTITLYDGSLLPLRNETTRYTTLMKGVEVSLSLSSADADTLQKGRGGAVDITVRQAEKPYPSGAFTLPLMTYTGSSREQNSTREVSVNLEGKVNSGSCTITSGKDLQFIFSATPTEFRQIEHSRNRSQLGVQNMAFDCVNVSGISLRFSSPDMKQGLPGVLFDNNTGVGLILGYEGGGRKGDIHWDNSEIQLPVNNDALSLAIGLYTRGGDVSPGAFSFTGVYHAEYN